MVSKKVLQKKNEVANAWKEYFLSRYPIRPPKEIVEYIEECTSQIVESLFKDLKDVEKPLDDLMRYLATDTKLSAGGSIGTIFYLKKLFLDIAKLNMNEFLELNRRIDLLVCKAFDMYMNAREDVYRARFRQMEFELKAQMRAYEFCMKYCPYVKKAKEMGMDPWDLPKEELEKLEKGADEH